MTQAIAEVVREYGPFPDADAVHGVSFDGRYIWVALGERLCVVDPSSGETVRSIRTRADAGTAFDGKHLFQVAGEVIRKIDPDTGDVLATIPAPSGSSDSGLAWAEGSLWVGQFQDRQILQLDPETGAVLRTIQSDRFVTGVTWIGDELWHGTWQNDTSELRRLDPANGAMLARLEMPEGTGVSGLEADGSDRFYCGGGPSRTVRAVRRPAGGAR